ncbi:ribonuclease III [bacterium]|nr:ribonuclease III [bacterium]|tara:strand:- start:267 stop:965 length:699 start_codon:yes stop_codon:yes gene_type:complete
MNSIDFSVFEKKINVTFKNKNLLKQAFTHRSYINEHSREGLSHNERMEFLGDAVLELVVTEYLFKKYPQKTEGDLTAYRAALVNTTTLSNTAQEIGMNDYLLLSRGERQDKGRARQYILANTFEALIGALYLDQEYDKAAQFIAEYLFPQLENIVAERLWQDAKSKFQEKAQEVNNITPNYKVLEESGPDHDKIFVVGVFLNNTLVAQGEGSSKQNAEQHAAQNALEKRKWE